MTYSEFKDVLLKTALEKGCDAAEVYAVDTDRFFVEVMEGDVDSYSVSKSISLALRVTVNGRDGYAYTMLLDEAESFVMRAMENAGACQSTNCPRRCGSRPRPVPPGYPGHGRRRTSP